MKVDGTLLLTWASKGDDETQIGELCIDPVRMCQAIFRPPPPPIVRILGQTEFPPPMTDT